MGVMDKFLNAMQLNDDAYDNEDEYYDDGVEEEAVPVKVSPKQDDAVAEEKPKKSLSKVTPMKQNRRNNNTSGAGMKVCAVEDEFSLGMTEEKKELADYYITHYDEVR